MKFIFRICLVCLCAWAKSVAQAHSPADPKAIAHAMKKLFDKPGAPLQVGPVSVEGDYAVAGWLQGQRGGRALLQKRNSQWVIVVCAGDGLTQVESLTQTGMHRDAAQRLTQKVATSEARLPTDTLLKFASFEGMLRVDNAAANGHAHGVAAQGQHKH